MGCASSKRSRRDNLLSSLPRSHSMPLHHPAQRKGDAYHVVALASSTLGSPKLDSSRQKPDRNSILNEKEAVYDKRSEANAEKKKDVNSYLATHSRPAKSNFSKEVSAVRTWSSMMEGKISKMPKTPTETPPGEPETINTWELMEGLEDASPLRCFSFDAFSNRKISDLDPMAEADSPKPLWVQTATPESIITDFDPEIISNFRKALEQLSPPNTCRLRSPEGEKVGSVQERIRAFQDRIDQRLGKKAQGPSPSSSLSTCPRLEDRVVLYFTSLRGVRKTYEDCCHVRLILKGLGVRVDERDVSMHRDFLEELHEILGFGFGGLPRVFVKGIYVGGAEEVMRTHDSGELDQLAQGCEKVDEGGGIACERCGDVRFIPCDTCNGSCKVYVEEEEEDEDEDEEWCGDFVRCPYCNENGLIHCPYCSS